MRLTVTQDDIDIARKQRKTGLCPTDYALLRIYPNASVITGTQQAWITSVYSDNELRFRLSRRHTQWINEYDAGGTVEPTTFTLAEEPYPS